MPEADYTALQMDPLMVPLVSAALVILIVGFILRKLRQPALVGYILAGILLGPQGFAIFTDLEILSQMGSVGVVLLLFFVGLEATPREFLSNWKVALFGTLLQVLASVLFVFAFGYWFGWSVQQIVLVGFVISLSCTAVVINYLRDRGKHTTRVAQDALSILITQDILVIPMLIILGIMSGGIPSYGAIGMQLVGGAAIFGFTFWLIKSQRVFIPFSRFLRNDQELQFFAAFLVCFGFATFTGLFHLSTALGAFIAGMYVGQAHETEWAKSNLNSFRVVFVSIFFASIGMLIDINLVIHNWRIITFLVLLVLFTNTLANALIMMGLGRGIRDSLLVGALLAHVGEFSFVLAAIGWQTEIITDRFYQLTVSVIAVSLLVAPLWASGCRAAIFRAKWLKRLLSR